MSHEINAPKNAPKGLRFRSSDEIENSNSRFELCYICPNVTDNFFNGDAVDFDRKGYLSLWLKNIPDEDGVYPWHFMGCEYLDPNGALIRSQNWIAGTQVHTNSIVKAWMVSDMIVSNESLN